MRQEVRELVELGPLPSEEEADEDTLAKYERLLDKIHATRDGRGGTGIGKRLRAR